MFSFKDFEIFFKYLFYKRKSCGLFLLLLILLPFLLHLLLVIISKLIFIIIEDIIISISTTGRLALPFFKFLSPKICRIKPVTERFCFQSQQTEQEERCQNLIASFVQIVGRDSSNFGYSYINTSQVTLEKSP